LIIFVIGMVSLLIGMSLTVTGFGESMMGRRTANSLQAFYVANAGVEDALYKIRSSNYGNPGPDTFTLEVGEGTATVTVEGGEERRILSVGKYGNIVRKIRVVAVDTAVRPGFTRAIHAGLGGIAFEHGVVVSGEYKTGEPYPVTVYSNTHVKGKVNGTPGSCTTSNNITRIAGHVYAAGSIEGIVPGDSGPCIEGDAFAGSLDRCRVLGTAYSTSLPIDDFDCPHNNLCDPVSDPETCREPIVDPLPDIGVESIKHFLEAYADVYTGNCRIGGVNDCSRTRPDGKKEIGNQIIQGDMLIALSGNREIFISGPVWVTGNLTINQNHDINLSPEIGENSQIILASGNVLVNSNVKFVSIGSTFLLLASEYENNKPNVCQDSTPAIDIRSNVRSILFYAINGCAKVTGPGAGEYFHGAILGEGVYINNNTKLMYDPALQDAEFFLRRRGGWQITSFTQK
jgi:hypothetical protein